MKKDWTTLFNHVSKVLYEKLPKHLSYHNPEHTFSVIKFSEFLAMQEKISEADILLLKTAALYHDIGFIKGADAHELESERIAANELPSYGYTTEEIDIIIGLIEATSIPQQPKTLLEKIIADADLEYLGTDKFEAIGYTLYEELKHFSPQLSLEKWNNMQIAFLQKHSYHTDYCLQNRAKKKELNLKKLKERLQ